MSPRVYLPAELPGKPAGVLRHLAAAALHGASLGLARLARQLVAVPPAAAPSDAVLPHVEFHAEAGALEGALYVDGQFVGLLPGVQRL
jgi:hypothetical protein